VLNLALGLLARHRYNRQVVTRCTESSVFAAFVFAATVCGISGCAASLGPGYLVEKQEIQVAFLPQPEPLLHVTAEYHLQNTGTQQLDSLRVRLPGRRFSSGPVAVSVDGDPRPLTPSAENPRDTLIQFMKPWSVGANHTLLFSYDIHSASALDSSIAFSAGAFALPAEAWAPSLPQAPGVFGFGGVPPKKWELKVRVPQGFLVHASGGKEKHFARGKEVEFRFEQTANDLNPFLVAGRYRETRQDRADHGPVHVWSRTELNSQSLQLAADSFSNTLAMFDSLFAAREKSRLPLWIVECPVPSGCIAERPTVYSSFLYGQPRESFAEMISRDTVLVAAGDAANQRQVWAAPALAAGWLGYGQNPGFYEQQAPMSALPAFAAALAQEASYGPGIRAGIIQRALSQIPVNASRASNDDPIVSRAKSLLFFYALRDRVGAENFQKGLQHMLAARRQRGFDITDLISALEQESHQDIGPYVRQWIKRPGVPEDFRAMYSQSAAKQDFRVQEATP